MPRTILIVDDIRMNREILKNILEKDYSILEAGNGQEALEVMKANSGTLSAVLLDVMMPVMDGFETLEHIREDPDLSQIPVIIVTGSVDEESRTRALSLGASDFLVKPFNPQIIFHCVVNNIALRETTSKVNTMRLDKLTGLYNQDAFNELAGERISRQEPGSFFISCLNIENFKVINDQYGRKKGDEVIKHVASCLKECMSSVGGICCRLHGDRFALFFPSSVGENGVFDSIHEAICKPDIIEQTLTIRVGRYRVTDLSIDVGSMCDRAFLAAGSIRGKYGLYLTEFDESLLNQLVEEHQIANNMTEALELGQFEPWFQPQYNHSNGAMIGAEALSRWRKDGKIIPPYKFIPVFEKNGFIYEMDKCIWEKTCQCLRRWMDSGSNVVPVSVNISRQDIFHKDIFSVITGLVEKYRIPIELLRLEVTESAFADGTGVIVTFVKKLIDYGFTVEIDDFGSGYSSLNSLKDVPAQVLKLDMKFFEHTSDNQREGNIVQSVVRMAKWLGMTVIAEGVEDRDQADYLRTIGCNYIQGYLYAKPMPLDEFEGLLCGSETETGFHTLKTLKELDNNAFWDPKSMDTLIFNSYVGGAFIFEFNDGHTTLMRANQRLFSELPDFIPRAQSVADLKLGRYLRREDWKKFLQTIKEAIASNTDASNELKMTDPGNPDNVGYISITLRVIAKADDSYLFYCVARNETERHIADRKAKDNAQQLKAVIDNMRAGVIACTRKDGKLNKLVLANERFFGLFGYKREAFLADIPEYTERIVDSDKQRIIETVERNAKGQSPFSAEFTIDRFGIPRRIQVKSNIIKLTGVDEPVFLYLMYDITDLYETSRRERDFAAQMNAVIGSIDGGVTVTRFRKDGEMELSFANEGFFEMLGYTEEQFKAEVPGGVADLVLPEDRKKTMELVAGISRKKGRAAYECRAVRRDGKVIWTQCRNSVVSLSGVGDNAIITVISDITELRLAEQKQREAAFQLRMVLDNISSAISVSKVKDNEATCLFSNNRYFELVGYSEDEYSRKFPGSFGPVVDEDRARVTKEISKAVATGKEARFDYRIIRGDGQLRWLRHRLMSMKANEFQGEIQFSVIDDITEQYLVEQTEKEKATSALLKTVMDNIEGGICANVLSSDGIARILFANDKFYTMYGYTREEFIEKFPNPVDDVYPPDREGTLKIISKTLEEGSSATYEYRCYRKDGSLIWVRAVNSLVSIEGIGDKVLLAITSDVTKERAATEKNRIYAEHLAAAAENIGGGLTATIMKDGEMQEYLFINSRYYELMGYTKDEYHRRSYKDVVHPDDLEYVYTALKQNATRKEPVTLEYRIIRQDGSIAWIKAVVSHCFFSGIDVPVELAIFNDISKRKEAERLVEESRDQLLFLNSAAHDVLSQPDSEKAISGILGSLRDFFGADCTFIFEVDKDTGAATRRYKAWKKGVLIPEDSEVAFQLTTSADWFQKLILGEFFVLKEKGDTTDPALSGWLSSRKMNSVILAPMMRDGTLIGFAGAENPTRGEEQLDNLKALADYLSVLLTRRDLTRQLQNADSELLDNLPFGAALYELNRNDMSLKVVHLNRQYWKLVGRDSRGMGNIVVMDAIHPADQHAVRQEIAIAIREGRNAKADVRILHGDGNYRTFHITGRIVTDSDSREKGSFLLYAAYTLKDSSSVSYQEMLPMALSAIMSASPEMAFVKDRELRYICASPMAARTAGCRSVEEMIGKSDFDLFEPEIAAEYVQEDRRTLEEGRPNINKINTISSEGKDLKALTSKYPLFDAEGHVIGLYGTSRDVSDELEKESQLRTITDNMPGGIFRYSADTDEFSFISEGMYKSLGYSPQEFKDKFHNRFSEMVWHEDRDQTIGKINSDIRKNVEFDSCEYRIETKGGELKWFFDKGHLVTDEKGKRWFDVVVLDITERKNTESMLGRQNRHLQTLAEKDPLTGVLNRATFSQKVNELIRTFGDGAQHALLMLDIDNFKLINDTSGHGSGDQLLLDTVSSLSSVLRKSDLVGRLGGDEFIVFLANIQKAEMVSSKAQKICELSRKPFGYRLETSVSIGISISPDGGSSFDELYKAADSALCHVKNNGKNNFAFYQEDMTGEHGKTLIDGSDGERPRMLVADDDKIVHSIMEKLFGEQFIIEKAINGGTALSRLRQYTSSISVVLLDLMMPDIDGFTILKTMQNNPELRNIPVIVISGAEDRETCIHAIREGATDYVVKPFDPDELRGRVRAAIAKAGKRITRQGDTRIGEEDRKES